MTTGGNAGYYTHKVIWKTTSPLFGEEGDSGTIWITVTHEDYQEATVESPAPTAGAQRTSKVRKRRRWGLLIGLIKDSSIVSVLSYLELTRVGQILMEKTFLPFQVFGIVALLYFLLCYPLSRLALYAERRLQVSG